MNVETVTAAPAAEGVGAPAKVRIVREGMYLVLPVPFRVLNDEIFVEAQAANGLDRWAENFSRVTVAAPIIPETLAPTLPGVVWRSISTLDHRRRIVCQPLPWAYTPAAFFKQVTGVRRLMAASIRQAEHLQFAIGGLVGDWAAVAAIEAIRAKRKYAIHTDRVEHELIRKTVHSASSARRLKVAFEAPLMERYHRHIITHCSLGLWHGEDCFRAYSPWCHESHLIHDVHTKATDQIGEAELKAKVERLRAGATLKVIYPGRLDPMKAPLEWLAALAEARRLGVRLEATWFGDGPLAEAALAEAERLDLGGIVRFPGFLADREELLQHLRAADVLVFTHVTPESPRNLLEALVSGTPILGYANPFAQNLLEGRGGGALAPLHDTEGLGRLIADVASDRVQLAELTLQAAQNGRRFTDAAVFAERSELLKRFA
jgi:glycosyltransferase involved in cell wall biosynthesis